MADDDPTPFVSYSAKEIFEKLDHTLTGGLAQINAKLDLKANAIDVARLQEMVEKKADKEDMSRLEHGREANRRDIDALLQWRARVTGIAVGAGALTGGVAGAIANFLAS